METKEIKAKISKEFSKSAWILLACWVAICTLFTTLCFVYGKEFQNGPPYSYTYYDVYSWLGIEYAIDRLYDTGISIESIGRITYDAGMLCLVIFLNIFIFAIVPLIYYLINRRKRKLTELTANEKEIVGIYSDFKNHAENANRENRQYRRRKEFLFLIYGQSAPYRLYVGRYQNTLRP